MNKVPQITLFRKKIAGFVNQVYFVFLSLRPTTWLRFWAEMIVAAALAGKSSFNLSHFFLGFVSLGPVLWGAAYILNDLTDINLDRQHPLKSVRPISSGKLDKKTAKFTVFILFFLSLLLGYKTNPNLIYIIILLSASEILYTLPNFRFKEKIGFDILLNSLNSALKFIGGYLTQAPALSMNNFPFIPLLFFAGIKMILFIGHRLQSRDIEEKNNIKSTTTKLTVKTLKKILFVVFFFCALLFVYSVIIRDFPKTSLFATLLVLGFSIPVVYKFLKKKVLINAEKNLNFRILIYFIYFIFSNLLSLLIIYQ